jgi:hypothetical protein
MSNIPLDRDYPPWIEAIARDLHVRREEIDAVAAGDDQVWTCLVASVIAGHIRRVNERVDEIRARHAPPNLSIVREPE